MERLGKAERLEGEGGGVVGAFGFLVGFGLDGSGSLLLLLLCYLVFFSRARLLLHSPASGSAMARRTTLAEMGNLETELR